MKKFTKEVVELMNEWERLGWLEKRIDEILAAVRVREDRTWED
jgi:hypothetical protein